MAAIWKLPVLFVCENNQFATEVPFSYAAAIPASPAGPPPTECPGFEVDGNDVVAVHGDRRRSRRPRAARRRADADRMQDLPHTRRTPREWATSPIARARRSRNGGHAAPSAASDKERSCAAASRGRRPRSSTDSTRKFDAVDAPDRPVDRRGQRRQPSCSVARPGDGACRHVYREAAPATIAAPAAGRQRANDFLAGHARSASSGDGAQPADLRSRRGDRQARRKLPDHGRAVREVRARSGCATRRSASAASSAWAAARP